MPLNQNPPTNGWHDDGTMSDMYCYYCFKDGTFRNEDWTVQHMQEFVKRKLREKGIPSFISHFFVRRIAKLKRWRKEE